MEEEFVEVQTGQISRQPVLKVFIFVDFDFKFKSNQVILVILYTQKCH